MGIIAMNNENLQAGIAFFVLGLVFLVGAWDLPMGTIKEIGLGAAPKFFSVVLLVIGIFVAVRK